MHHPGMPRMHVRNAFDLQFKWRVGKWRKALKTEVVARAYRELMIPNPCERFVTLRETRTAHGLRKCAALAMGHFKIIFEPARTQKEYVARREGNSLSGSRLINQLNRYRIISSIIQSTLLLRKVTFDVDENTSAHDAMFGHPINAKRRIIRNDAAVRCPVVKTMQWMTKVAQSIDL